MKNMMMILLLVLSVFSVKSEGAGESVSQIKFKDFILGDSKSSIRSLLQTKYGKYLIREYTQSNSLVVMFNEQGHHEHEAFIRRKRQAVSAFGGYGKG